MDTQTVEPTSTTNKQIYQLMPKLMGAIGAIGKDRKNAGQGYKFRSVDDVLNAMHAPMVDLGISLKVKCHGMNSEAIQEDDKSGKKRSLYRTSLLMDLSFIAPDGSEITHTLVGEGADYGGDKSANKAMSGAFKYGAFLGLCIPVDDDAADDGDSSSPAVAPKAESAIERMKREKMEREALTQPAESSPLVSKEVTTTVATSAAAETAAVTTVKPNGKPTIKPLQEPPAQATSTTVAQAPKPNPSDCKPLATGELPPVPADRKAKAFILANLTDEQRNTMATPRQQAIMLAMFAARNITPEGIEKACNRRSPTNGNTVSDVCQLGAINIMEALQVNMLEVSNDWAMWESEINKNLEVPF